MKFMILMAVLLLSTPAFAADNIAAGPAAGRTVIGGSYLIFIGQGAGSEATNQKCSVALGKNVQLPEGERGNHVLATRKGITHLVRLDDITVERINGALADYGRVWHPDWKEAPRRYSRHNGPRAMVGELRQSAVGGRED